jgi:hypothetical protein
VKRKAIIIGNEGVRGTSGFLGGVAKDLEGYSAHLLSPVGGFWNRTEVTTMMRPTVAQLRQELKTLSLTDYALVIFGGHGWYSTTARSTCLQLRDGEEIDSAELRVGAKRQTLILDCCRKHEAAMPITLQDARKFAEQRAMPTGEACRSLYDGLIIAISPTIVVMNACAIGESAGDDEQKGGYYSFGLLEWSREWARSQSSIRVSSASVVDAHDRAAERVKRDSGQRQNPKIDKPRSEPYFPFCVFA